MDTFGSLIDKLLTVNLKTVHNIHNTHISTNLVQQSRKLINEIDELDQKLSNGNIDPLDIIRPQFKTY